MCANYCDDELNTICKYLTEDGYTEEEIDRIMFHLAMGRTLDAAMQWDMY